MRCNALYQIQPLNATVMNRKWQLILLSALFCTAVQSANVYEKVGDAYYFIGRRNITQEQNITCWFNARRNCRKEGGQLVSVQTEMQMVELQDYILRKGYPNGSIFATSGLSFNSGSPYRWDAIGQPLGFTNWLPYDGPLPNSYLSLQLVESDLYMVRSWGFDPYYICEYESPQRLIWSLFRQYFDYLFISSLIFLAYAIYRMKTKSVTKENRLLCEKTTSA